jgi:hypothetical protein
LKRALFKAPFLPVTELAGLTTTEGTLFHSRAFHHSLIFEAWNGLLEANCLELNREKRAKKTRAGSRF